MEEALALFAENGYLGTSMSDIASRLGITKGALYKHYAGKKEILNRIVERMGEMDLSRACEYEMPETNEPAETYLRAPAERVREYTIAQFRHWTEDTFSSRFRRMLTLEQYRDPEMARLYQDYLAGGPVEYMASVFRSAANSDAEARQLALEFYGPMFLLYSVYDGAADRRAAMQMLKDHVGRFMQNTIHAEYGEEKMNAIVYTSNAGSAARYAEMLSSKMGIHAYSMKEARGKVPFRL